MKGLHDLCAWRKGEAFSKAPARGCAKGPACTGTPLVSACIGSLHTTCVSLYGHTTCVSSCCILCQQLHLLCDYRLYPSLSARA